MKAGLQFELVVPAYNEGATLEKLIGRAARAATEAGHTPETFRLVVVDNGSTDDSAAVLERLGQGELARWFRVVTVMPNQGYGNGIFQGLSSTTAPVIGWSHADMQCDPADAMAALRKCQDSGEDRVIVKGLRSGRNLRDRLVSRVFELNARLILNLKVFEINAQPKVFPRELLAALTNPPKTFAFDLYVLYHAARAGYRLESVPVHFPPRIHGASKWAASFLGRYKTILGIVAYMERLAREEGRL